ncbi:hypothetical protein [Mucilaginibacter sp.]|uniref:hypothetical protein n=1 Tax=Mucilaginibacter sp. TaxID=1882438 RepID=UPI00260C9F3E|nr:hypothetical protein [Mucilaginibacter sp.]MDB4923615.1 hypothetical protein [Mucilaginibacter sp.]
MTVNRDFEQSIQIYFQDLIEEFNLELIKPYENADTFLLKGEKCDIEFSYDRGETGCAFIPKTSQQFNPGYRVDFVYKFLYPFGGFSDMAESTYDQKKQLSWYASIIQNDLKNVLKGDFSWLNDYITKKDMHGYLTALALCLASNHPIHKKFVVGDPTWMADAEKYAIDNNFIHL